MARNRREEQRLLTRDEAELVDRTRHPALAGLPDGELSDLVARLRERWDRAGDIAKRQRREMRGKAGAAGATPAADDTGTRAKRDLLAAALQRANKERSRRGAQAARADLKANARRALALRRAAGTHALGARPPGEPAAGTGMRPLPDADTAPSGALDAEGHRPVLHRTGLPR